MYENNQAHLESRETLVLTDFSFHFMWLLAQVNFAQRRCNFLSLQDKRAQTGNVIKYRSAPKLATQILIHMSAFVSA